MSEVLGQEIPLKARGHILCVTGEQTWQKFQKFWLMVAAMAAKRNIFRTWGEYPPEGRAVEDRPGLVQHNRKGGL